MIKFQCPECDKRLNVGEAKAGQFATCPACKSNIRIPDGNESTDEKSYQFDNRIDSPAKPAEPPAQWQRAAPKDSQDGGDAPSRDDAAVPARPRRKRRRKRPRGTTETLKRMDIFWIWVIAASILGILSLVPVLVWPSADFLPQWLAGIYSVIGSIWFLYVAFSDDTTEGLLCMFVPFYVVYYFVNNYEETKRPFLVSVLGALLSFLALVVEVLRKGGL